VARGVHWDPDDSIRVWEQHANEFWRRTLLAECGRCWWMRGAFLPVMGGIAPCCTQYSGRGSPSPAFPLIVWGYWKCSLLERTPDRAVSVWYRVGSIWVPRCAGDAGPGDSRSSAGA
jgi:hypothetical protein